MLPFTTAQFLHVFEQYNLAIWPAQVVANVLGAIAVVLAITVPRGSGRVISAVLAALWGWTGVAYHLLFFRAINGAALGFGALFLIQTVLWIWFGVLRPRLSFRLRAEPISLIGLVLIAYAMLVYPALGALLGHAYPRSPAFGVTPCPTAIFTWGLLLCSDTRVPRGLLVVPFLWSLLGFGAALALGIYEDTGLLIAGLLGVGLLLWRDRAPRPAAR